MGLLLLADLTGLFVVVVVSFLVLGQQAREYLMPANLCCPPKARISKAVSGNGQIRTLALSSIGSCVEGRLRGTTNAGGVDWGEGA